MRTSFYSFIVLAASLATSLNVAAATPVATCGDVSNVQVQPASAIRYVIGLGKREARLNNLVSNGGGNAESGDSGNVDGGHVIVDSGGGNQINDDSNAGGDGGETTTGDARGGNDGGHEGGNAESGNAGNANGGTVEVDSEGGNIHNEGSNVGGNGGTSTSGDAQGGNDRR